jgi:hypothetical protein
VQQASCLLFVGAASDRQTATNSRGYNGVVRSKSIHMDEQDEQDGGIAEERR